MLCTFYILALDSRHKGTKAPYRRSLVMDGEIMRLFFLVRISASSFVQCYHCWLWVIGKISSPLIPEVLFRMVGGRKPREMSQLRFTGKTVVKNGVGGDSQFHYVSVYQVIFLAIFVTQHYEVTNQVKCYTMVIIANWHLAAFYGGLLA